MPQEENELEGVPEPGDVVVEKYRVDRVLGVGGMGCVVAATHLTLDQQVAIKFLLAKAARNPKNLERFKREAQAAAKIRSDHVAQVRDVGALPNGAPYMVMEYLDGEDLSDRIKRAPLEVPESVDYVLQAAVALAEAHAAGIVHRDLKPANVFLARQADDSVRVKVLDFGISKIVGEGNDLTKTSALMGSPLYMAPEQMMSAKSADKRADIWAMGCILFESLTRQPPFIGETLPEICSKILTAPPTPMLKLLPHAPPELGAVIDRMLCKSPDDRFQNLGEVAFALAPWATPVGLRAAQAVRRVLGQPLLPGIAPPSSTTPYGSSASALGSGPGVHPGQASWGSHAGSAGQPHPGPAGQPHPGVSQTGPQLGWAQSGPYPAARSAAQSASQSSPGFVVAPHAAGSSQPETYPSPQHAHTSQPGVAAVTASPGIATHPGGAIGAVLQQGASTAAPVAQTYSDLVRPRRSKLPLVLVGAALGLVGAGTAFVLVKGGATGNRDAALGDASTTASATPNDAKSAATPGDVHSEVPSAEPSEPVSSAGAEEPEPPVPSPRSGPVRTSAVRPTTKSGTTVRPAPQPVQPKSGTGVRAGDDQFNTRGN